MTMSVALPEKMSSLLEEELAQLPREVSGIPHTELVTCHSSMVQIKVRMTAHKHVVVCVQFPADYPNSFLLIELKSKTIPSKFIDSLVSVCDQEMKKHRGKKQVMELLRFVCEFMSSNPFIVCSEELSYVKKQLLRDGDELKVKQKAGTVRYVARQGRYFVDFALSVPHEYPVKHVLFDLKGSNFPADILKVCSGQVAELSRQCIEPPLRRKPSDSVFEPHPSLQVVADYVVKETARRYPLEVCPFCKEAALPEDPKDVVVEENNPKFLYRAYCGHCYHSGCLETYTKTPPFTGGKKCLACKQRLAHDKWNVQPKLAEERWAHQEARKREIAEVADFLGV